MSTTVPQPGTASRVATDWLQRLWKGGGKPAILWRRLIGSVLLLLLAWLAYTIGVVVVRWPMPGLLIGVVTLLIAGAALVYGLVNLLRVFVQLGVRRLIIRLGILYLTAVLIVGLATPSASKDRVFWITIAINAMYWPLDKISTLARTIISMPEDIRFSITGQRPPIRMPGVDWPDGVPPPPIFANKVPPGGATTQPTPVPILEGDGLTDIVPDIARPLQVGGTVHVTGTAGTVLRARARPSLEADVVARFPAKSVLEIVDGPQIVDGRTWWKVRGERGEGWCVAEFLTP